MINEDMAEAAVAKDGAARDERVPRQPATMMT